jgi:hypothetical protein
MCIRLSRIRFIVFRTCCLSTIIIVSLQIFAYINTDNRMKTRSILNRAEFSNENFDDDPTMTDQQRIEKITSFEPIKTSSLLNWTYIFVDIYNKKQTRFKQQQQQQDNFVPYKTYLADRQSAILTDKIDIFEETTVTSFDEYLSTRHDIIIDVHVDHC